MSSPKTTRAKGSPKSAKTRRRRKPSAATLSSMARTLERDDAGWTVLQAIREMAIPCKQIEKHLAEAERLLDALDEAGWFETVRGVDLKDMREGAYDGLTVGKAWRKMAAGVEKAESEIRAAALLAMPVLKGRTTTAWQREDGQLVSKGDYGDWKVSHWEFGMTALRLDKNVRRHRAGHGARLRAKIAAIREATGCSR